MLTLLMRFRITSVAAPRIAMTLVASSLCFVAIYPVNVCDGGVSCTMNTRYNDMSLPLDIVSLRHFPKTVAIYAYEI